MYSCPWSNELAYSTKSGDQVSVSFGTISHRIEPDSCSSTTISNSPKLRLSKDDDGDEVAVADGVKRNAAAGTARRDGSMYRRLLPGGLGVVSKKSSSGAPVELSNEFVPRCVSVLPRSSAVVSVGPISDDCAKGPRGESVETFQEIADQTLMVGLLKI